MNKKLNFIFKNKKIYKVFLYLLVFFVIIFFVYLFTPKFFNYTPTLIQKSLNKNSNINIKNISNISYKFFPSPRLRLSGSYLEFGENILQAEDAEIDIILNPLSIINYKILDYNKFLVKGGSTIIELKKINRLFNYIKDNKKKINFEKSNIILLRKKEKFFEINSGTVKINTKNNTQQLNINGLFNNHKISFILDNVSVSKTKIALKIPELDVSTNILLETNDNYETYKGLVNTEVINNFFQFNFIKEKYITINKGFVRSSLTNALFKGDISFKPYFTFNLDIEPSTLSIQKIISIFLQKYFLEESNNTEAIKNFEGSLNFKNMFDGTIIFENREILFKNFKIGKNNKIFFDAKIIKLGRKGKIQFNLITERQNKKTNTKEIKITGFIIPSILKVTFKKIMLGDETFSEEKIKNYEVKFKNEVIVDSLGNIFNEKKIRNFLKTF